MAGVVVHFPAYDGHSTESNPPPTSGLSRWQAYGAFYFYAWIVMHILAILATKFVATVPHFNSSLHLKDLMVIYTIMSMDGVVLLVIAVRVISTFVSELRTLESTISTLRTSLRSVIADEASQSRYQVRVYSAAIDTPEERDSNIAGEERLSVPVAPSKLVAHADPNWMNDQSNLELSQCGVNNHKKIEEESAEQVQKQDAEDNSATQNPARGRNHFNRNRTLVNGSRPSWVEDGTLCIVCHNPFGPEGGHILGTSGHVFHPPCLVDYSKVKSHCFCDVAIDTRYYLSICLQESMPPELRNDDGRSSLHGGFDWEITIDS